MKKTIKLFTTLLLLAGICAICGINSSCRSQDVPMYKSTHSDSKVINQKYKVKGTNRSNSSTYRSSF